MAEQRNILILGASNGGLAAAHYIARHTLPKLAESKKSSYTVTLVDPSTHYWWHIAAPREIVDVSLMPHEKYFKPIKDGFKQYSQFQDKIIFRQASATGIDTAARTVTIKEKGADAPETIPYYALIIATGVRSPTPLTTLHGEHTISMRALEDMNQKLKVAKEVLIAGGGPVGVETAGEIAHHLKNVHVTLVTGGKKLLPVFSDSRAEKAQKLLQKLGVTVTYNAKIEKSEDTSDGKTRVTLSDGKVHNVDVYIPAFGVQPNTEWLPAELKNEKNYVKTNPNTLRVDAAGPRVYALGDIAGIDNGGALNLYGTVPVWGANFNHDIFSDAGLSVTIPAEKKYTPNFAETQLVPVGPKGGVAAFNGWPLPSFLVAMFKGKDYMASQVPKIHEGGQFAKA